MAFVGPEGSMFARDTLVWVPCPRLDNADMADTGFRTISSTCPIHWPSTRAKAEEK
jgi:hypothetical protein